MNRHETQQLQMFFSAQDVISNVVLDTKVLVLSTEVPEGPSWSWSDSWNAKFCFGLDWKSLGQYHGKTVDRTLIFSVLELDVARKITQVLVWDSV